MNGSQMVAAVYNRTGMPSSDAQLTQTVVLSFLNEAVESYQSQRSRWPWLEDSVPVSLVAGVSTYALPAPVGQVIHVIAGDGTARRVLQEVTIEEAIIASHSEGAPMVWAQTWEDGDQSLVIGPAPSTAAESLSVQVVAAEAALENSSGSTLRLPADLHRLIVEHACGLVFAALGDAARSGAFAPITSASSMSQLRRAAASRRGVPQVRLRGGL